MSQLSTAWTRGFQSPRPVQQPGDATVVDAATGQPRELLQGVMTLKHMAVNSLENTAPFDRHTFDANATCVRACVCVCVRAMCE